MERIAVGFSGFLHYSAKDIVKTSQEAERLGYDSAWVAETRFVDDGLTLLGGLSTVTRRLRLSNAILGHTFARTPVLLALGATTIDLLSDGRSVLGLGPGALYYVSKQGVNITKPLQALREYVLAIRELLSGEEVTFHGDFVDIKAVKLGIVPIQKRLPIFLGISGPRMLRMSGEIADGVVLNGLVTPDYIRKAIELVRQGAESSGRSMKAVEVASVIYVSMSDDRQRAIDALKPTLADYFVHQSHTARDSGVDGATLKKIQDAWQRGDQTAAARAVPDSIVQAINAAGTAKECREKVDEYREAGVQLPIVFPIPPKPTKTLEELIN